MPTYRFWRLRKLIRDTTTPIPMNKAKKWDKILGRTYNASVFGAMCCLMMMVYEQGKKRQAEALATGIPVESNAEYWIRKLGYRTVKVISVGGPAGTTTKYYQDGKLVTKAEQRAMHAQQADPLTASADTDIAV